MQSDNAMPGAQGAGAPRGRADGLYKVELRTTCRECNAGVPINGPLERLACPNCMTVADVRHFWRRLLERMVATAADAWTDRSTDHYSFDRFAALACPWCQTPVDEAALAAGALECPGCRMLLEAYVAPDWLQRVDGAFGRIYFGERDHAPDGAAALRASHGAEPAVMKCPNCGAGLELGSAAERSTTCEFCRARVYIPDDLWRVLHPVPTTHFWFLCIAGRTQIECEEARRAQAQRTEAEAQRAQALADRAAAEAWLRTRRQQNRRIALLVAAAVGGVVLLVLVYFLAK